MGTWWKNGKSRVLIQQVPCRNLWVGAPCSLNCGLDALQLKERCHNAVDFRSKTHHFRCYKVVSIKGSVHQSDWRLPTRFALVCSSGSLITDHVKSASVWRQTELQPAGQSLNACTPMEREWNSICGIQEFTHYVQVFLFLCSQCKIYNGFCFLSKKTHPYRVFLIYADKSFLSSTQGNNVIF